MRAKFKTSSAIEALNIVSIGKARGATLRPNDDPFLFKFFNDKDGSPHGQVLSRSDGTLMRAGFVVDELDGLGEFALPIGEAQIMKTVPDDVFTIASTTEERPEGTRFSANMLASSGLEYDCSTLDPHLVAPCERDYETAQQSSLATYPAAVLRVGLTQAGAFLPRSDQPHVVEPHFHAVQIFDSSKDATAKGNGHLYCSDGTRAFYFHCPAFKDKCFAISQAHLSPMTQFLDKCEGEVDIGRGTNMFFAADKTKDQIFGWVPQTAPPLRFSYYSLAHDKWVLRIPKELFLTATAAAEIALERGREDYARIIYSRNKEAGDGTHAIRLMGGTSSSKFESFPVPAREKLDEPSVKEDFAWRVSLKALRSLVAGVKGREFEFRVCPLPAGPSRPRGGAHFRTIESVEIDGHDCTITRYVSSIV